MATMQIKQLKATNAQILNAIRNEAPLAYQQRVPAATQGDIAATVSALTQYKVHMNEFVDALVNRIGDVVIRSKMWTNPLAQFKRGMMQYGDTIEEIGVDLIEAHRYDPNECYEDVFKCADPNVAANYHSINRQDYYKLTVNDIMLRRAFLDDYGLQQLVSTIMEAPYKSDSWDEYLIMRNLFTEYAVQDGFYKVQVPDASSATTPDDQKNVALQITQSVRSMVGKMKFLSGSYNAQGLPTATQADELVLFATPDFVAMLDVNVLAFAFNTSAADLSVRVVEVDDFGIDGCQAILADRDFFMCADTLIDFESIRNPAAISWNYWLHHHGIYSVSRFVNVVMFTTEAGSQTTVPVITVSDVEIAFAPDDDGTVPTSAPLGESTRFVATVNGAVVPDVQGVKVPQGVVWSITSSDAALKQRTFIDAEGVLHVAADEQATKVTIQAATTYVSPEKPVSEQSAKTATLDVTLGQAAAPAPTPTPEPGDGD